MTIKKIGIVSKPKKLEIREIVPPLLQWLRERDIEAGRFSLRLQEFFLSRRVRETSFFLKVRKRREHGSPPGQG
jgi:hypothetical protein